LLPVVALVVQVRGAVEAVLVVLFFILAIQLVHLLQTLPQLLQSHTQFL
jgi:hypothetical protein